MPPRAAEDFRFRLQRLQVIAVLAGRRAWDRMTADFDPAWSAVAPQLVQVTAAVQLAAATAATEYVPAVLEETGAAVEPEVRILPAAFAGQAADGRSLPGLLRGAVVTAKDASSRGLPGPQALRSGGDWLDSTLRTAVMDAARDATSAEIAARPRTAWIRVVSPPSCPRCTVLSAGTYLWREPMPRHKNCFPAGVVVSGPGHSASARRWYDGELVVLTTASGQQLPATANHPVLTRRGWIPANLLHEGDEVVRSLLPEGAHSLAVPDHHEVPSRIEDVWDALRVMGVLETVPTSAEDFHGDGQHGYVDVVRAHGALRGELAGQSFVEPAEQLALAVGLERAAFLAGQRGADLVDVAQAALTRGLVGFGSLGESFFGGHLGCAHDAGFAGASPWQSGLSESFGDGSAADAVLLGQGVLAGSGLVGADDLLNRQVNGPRWDAPGAPFSVKTRAGYASRGVDLLERLSGQVELDRVVEVRRVQWSGHVYSLTSVEGWHSANSLIVSNCDCYALPVSMANPKYKPPTPQELFDRGQVTGLTRAERDRILAGENLVKVLNTSRDRWRERLAYDRRAGVDGAPSRPTGWAGGGTTPPPPGTTIHELFDRLTDRVAVLEGMRAAGIAA